MKDKLKKIIIGLFLLFTFITPTYAKKMKVADLEKEVEKRVSGAREIYVIGNYAFTNKHQLQIQDFMLAAKTISVDGEGKNYSQSIYDAMTINRISRSRDANTGNFKPWEIQSKNLVGKTTLNANTELDIRYIDYQFIPESTPIKNNDIKIFKDSELSSLGSNYQRYFSSFQKNDETLNFNYDESNHTISVTGVALKRETISPISLMSVKRIANTKNKYYIGLVIEIPDAKNNSKVIEKNWDIKDENGKTITLIDNDGSKGVGLIIELSSTASTKKTIISIDLDGSDKEYEATTLTIDWSKVEFEQDSEATFTVPSLDKATYQLKSSEDNNYNITGNITEQTIGSETGYYLSYTIKPTNPKSTMKIVVPCNSTTCQESTKTITYNDLKNGSITISHKIDSIKDSQNKFTITVDNDGEGPAYDATEYTFDYSSLTLIKSSKSTIVNPISESDYGKFSDKKWTKSTYYNVSFSTKNGVDSTVYVAGLIPIHSESVDGLKNTNYYLMYELETPTNVTENTTVKLNNNDELITLFNDNKLYILQSIESVTKGFTVTIDMDGDNNIEYSPYTITMLVGDLKLQKESTGSTYSIATENDFNGKNLWGFDFTSNTGLSFDGNTLKGTVREQTLTESTFTTGQEGYYVPIKISLPSSIAKGQKFTLKAKTETIEAEVSLADGDYQNRYVALLFKLTRDNSQTITYTIDYDGTGKEYLEEPVTINYSTTDITFKSKNTIKFKDANGDDLDTQVVYEGEIGKVTAKELTAPQYHTFDYWVKNTSKSQEYTFDTPLEQDNDIILMPHWTIDTDAFVSAKIKENAQNDGFKLKEENHNIVVEVNTPNVSSSKLLDTALPTIITDILKKDEITGITVEINSHSHRFIKSEDAKEQLTTLLSEASLNDTTLDKMPVISIKITSSDTVENITAINKTYTISFTSNFIVANELNDITTALDNDKINVIYINSDIDLENSLNISIPNREVTIKSLNGTKTIKDKELTEEGEQEQRAVIVVSDGTVNFEDLKIQGATRAIAVKGNAKVNAKKVIAVDSQDAGFDVAENTTFVGIDIGYQNSVDSSDKENYSYPTVCGKGKVTLKKTGDSGTEEDAKPTKVENYKRIVRHDNDEWQREDFLDPETHAPLSEFFDGDKLKDVYEKLIGTKRQNHTHHVVNSGHTHYYLKSENASYDKYYFRDSELSLIIMYYFGGGETVEGPTPNSYPNPYDHMFFFKRVRVKDGKTYVFDGWSTSEGNNKGLDNTKVELSLDKKNYYSHYTEGYSVQIPMLGKVKEDDGNNIVDGEVNALFGVTKAASESGATIQTLIDNEPEFAAAWEALNKKLNDGEHEGQKILNSETQKEIATETPINSNIKITIGTPNPSSLSMETIEEDNYKVIGNKVSGVINTQNDDDNKYYLPLTLTSTEFKDGKSTVTITDPNGHEEVYTYSSSTNNGIKTVSNDSTMKINLEILKSSKIKNNNSKIYNVAIDVDGADEDTYAIKSYDLDLTELKTAEELINNAAKNTQNATTLTMIKDSYIKSGKEKFTYKYDKNSEVTYYEDGEDEEYTFRLRKVVTDHEGPITIILRKNKVTEGSPEINGWKFSNFLTEVTKGTHEITLLQDVMKKTTLEEINAIEKVKDLGDHKYEVTLSKARLNEWLNSAYLDETADDGSLTEDNNANVVLEVELDESNEYLVSMQTKENFSIISNDKTTYKTNYINVKYENINKTIIKTPTEFLSNDNKTITVEDIKAFYEECKKWHQKVNNSEIYEG